MAATLQVLYPANDGSKFNFDYYSATHLPLVDEHFGKFLEGASVSKGLAGKPDATPAYHAIATLTFKDMETLQAAMAAAGPVVADIPNFTDSVAQMVVGEVIT